MKATPSMILREFKAVGSEFYKYVGFTEGDMPEMYMSEDLDKMSNELNKYMKTLKKLKKEYLKAKELDNEE